MSGLQDLLEAASIQKALIVDDAFDKVPTARDLVLDSEEWDFFFQDISAEDSKALAKVFPLYDEMRADELQNSNEFIEALWKNKTEIAVGLAEQLFKRYTLDKEEDLSYLTALQVQLEELGLTCEQSGRNFFEAANDADLLVIDLYLGSGQEQEDIDRSITTLKSVIDHRAEHPPLVILMSRSSRLIDKKTDYRDRAGLFESSFRIITKSDLKHKGKLTRILARLGGHYEDSLKLAKFLNAWNQGMEEARKNTLKKIRRLDLPDIAQIRQLLLDAEEAPTGAYLVDIFDRVLLHEHESGAPIIDAAIALKDLTTTKYPPPYVAGSRDLQDLVHAVLFQHPERLRLPGSDSKVSFGDILRRKPVVAADQNQENGEEQKSKPPSSLTDISTNQVMVVMSPACDLQRMGIKRVLMLVGDVTPLVPSDWGHKEDTVRTAVFNIEGQDAFWIKWDVKHIETLSHTELEELLGESGDFNVVARLRESHAMEIQQKLLANMGRIGLPAAAPATFEVNLSIYVPNKEQMLTTVNVPALEKLPGVCFVGRQGDAGKRLVLCEDACEAICDAIQEINLTQVHVKAHETIEYLRNTEELLMALENGIELPGSSSTALKEIPSPSGAEKLFNSKYYPRILGFVGNADKIKATEKRLESKELYSAGIVLLVGY